MSLKLKFSIKDLKFCKECMSIGDLSLYQPVFSQFSVAAISVDCYLPHSSSDLNQRWRLQKILPPPRPNTHTPCQPKRLHYRLKANLTPRVIISRRRGRGGGGGWVARGWRKMSVGDHAHRLFFIPTCLTVDIEASQWRSWQSGGKFLDQSTAWKNLQKTNRVQIQRNFIIQRAFDGIMCNIDNCFNIHSECF